MTKPRKTIVSKPPADSPVATTNKSGFPIVGIGASAGGLEALEQFFGNMPTDSGMAFVVIQHLDPTHVGIMPELLQRITKMKVLQATDRLKVKPNCVYVIPPNKSLSILNGSLYLLDPVEMRGLRLPVDIFFRSLADDMQEKSVGIILSGMGSDGSLGIKAIKEKNGLVLVQDPATAKFSGMPGSATQAVIADMIAHAAELPAKLIEMVKYSVKRKGEKEIGEKTLSSLEKIILLLRQQSGHDFSLYKKNTLMRRIERRKGVHQIDLMNSYVRLLQENPQEIDILFKELLIGVTSFFRDPGLWETLKNKILPDMVNQLPDGHVIRAWVPACSTGEEAYSLAIVFRETIEKMAPQKNISMQVFATDLDTDAIEKARRGLFPANITVDVSPLRLSKFFIPEDDGFRVNSSIREMVVFAPQNVIKDPPFTKLDILTCRNMLIYMEPELQRKLFSLFHYSLNTGGILVLGTAETLGNISIGFTNLDPKFKIFMRSVTSPAIELLDFPSAFHHKPMQPVKKTPARITDNIQSLTEQILLQRFAPASVMVNENGDIIYITGRTGKYLEPAAGKANMNIYSMAREGLLEHLPAALRKANQDQEAVILRNIRIGSQQGAQLVNVTLQRIDKPELLRGMIIILFNDVTANISPKKTSVKTAKQGSPEEFDLLLAELQQSREELQRTREEMQTSQEELKSTNEELQSTNEELQSTNEELTTSKEEMQSLNEELQTVNIELQSKVSDFLQANDDMKNLLNSTEIATLFLDKDLYIRRFTDEATQIFKLRPSDVGRPFTDQVNELQYPEIESHARKVLKTLVAIETHIAADSGKWYNIRIMPYRTLDDRIDGLVMTFTNVTAYKNLEIKLQETNEALLAREKALQLAETRYKTLFETSEEGILVVDPDSGKIKDINPYLIDLLGYPRAGFMEKAIWETGVLKDIVSSREKFTALQKNELVRYPDLTLTTADGRKINVEFISHLHSAGDVRFIQCQVRERIKTNHG